MTMWNYQLSYMRVVAILAIVLGHSIIIYTPNWNIYSTPYNSEFLSCLKEFINAFQLQIFFCISGYLFKEMGLIDLLGKKLKRLIIPFILVGSLYMVPMRLFADYPNYNGYTDGILLFLQQKDLGHLWFLPVLFCCFLLAIVIDKLFLRLHTKRYALYYGIGILLLILLFHQLLNRMHIWSFGYLVIHWFFWFAFGLYFSCNKEALSDIFRNKRFKIFIAILLTALLILRLILYSQSKSIHIINLVCNISIIVGLFVFIPNKPKSLRFMKYVGLIDKNSFGIYLFHSPIIYLLLDNYSYLSPWCLVPLVFLSSFCLSMLLTVLLRRIKLGFVIGE